MKENTFAKKIYTKKIVDRTSKKIKTLGLTATMDTYTFLNL